MDTAVAFILFNRPDHTRRSFASIRAARPERLFLISDGPRSESESDLVAQSRQIAEAVDWECDVTKIYADQNLGCGKRIASGITEVFQHVDQAIILEDDCVAHPSFYRYSQNLLQHYRDDQRVMAISGDNFQQGKRRGQASYYFSKYPHCWGWATWRRAWQHYDLAIQDWPGVRDGGLIRGFADPREQRYWTELFDKVHSGQIDTWDYSWTLCCWMHSGLTALPNVNLVSNIGFDAEATHTSDSSPLANLPTRDIGEIKHPKRVCRSVVADQWTDRHIFSGGYRPRLIPRLTNWLTRSQAA